MKGDIKIGNSLAQTSHTLESSKSVKENRARCWKPSHTRVPNSTTKLWSGIRLCDDDGLILLPSPEAARCWLSRLTLNEARWARHNNKTQCPSSNNLMIIEARQVDDNGQRFCQRIRRCSSGGSPGSNVQWGSRRHVFSYYRFASSHRHVCNRSQKEGRRRKEEKPRISKSIKFVIHQKSKKKKRAEETCA